MVLFTGSLTTDLVLLATTLWITIFAYFQWAYQYWKKKNCPFLTPKFPLGSSGTFLRNTVGFTSETIAFYNEIRKRGLKFAGIYIINRPVLVVIHPDYIRDILSKDFSHFVNRGHYYNEKDDPMSAHLFALDEKKWKNMRAKLSPTFTSGKMKMMFHTVLNCSKFMIEAIDKHTIDKSDINIREYLASFTTDVIGSCAFGIDFNSFKDPDSQFRKMGDKIFMYQGFLRSLELFVISRAPKLARKLGLKAVYPVVSKFFMELVTSSVTYREKNNFRRNDFLQLLIDMKNDTKDSEEPFTLNQLAAHVFSFFIAGFDTSSSTMNFVIYELCRNLDIQERVRKEIFDVLEKYEGEITYESLGEMKYLQQVIDESQRLWSPIVNLNRTCVKDYTLRNTDITIEKGTPIVIPLFSLQRDPEYYPDPERFDPERFNAEKKSSRHRYLHMPFGEGPRNCIGLRFGIMQSKIGLASILRNFSLKISSTTKMPLSLDNMVLLAKFADTLFITAEKL